MKVEKRDVLQFVKFGSVGLCSTVLDYGFFYVFFALCGLDKNLAQILSTLIAMTNSYFVNRYWTFGKTGGVQCGEIVRFVVVNLCSLLTTLLCLNLFHDVFGFCTLFERVLAFADISFDLGGERGVMFCKILALPFSILVNFLGNRLWVFGKKKEKNTH